MKLTQTFYLLVSLLCCMLWTAPNFAQEKERPEAAVSPLTAIGEISETQKQIIFNSLVEKLSKTYALISQERFLRAQEETFETLEEQQCTEAQCIRKIQELLQVENLFVLQVVRDGVDTQLSLTLITLDEKKVKNNYCSRCDTPALNERVSQLVDQLLDSHREQAVTPTPTSSSRWIWHTLATTTALITARTAWQASQEHQALTDDNRQLKKEIPLAGSQEKYEQLADEYRQNQDRKNTLRQKMLTLGTLSALSIGWELYLLLTPDETPAPPAVSWLSPSFKLSTRSDDVRYIVSFHWNW